MFLKSRNIFILTCSQALTLSGPPVVVLLGGIIGTAMAPSPTLTTLPIAAMVVGTATATVPAALWMRRVGRRRGFMHAAMSAALASLLAVCAIKTGSFSLFCLATYLLGTTMAFTQQYRFAAAESVPTDQVGRAVSFVLLGGIIAAFLGPELAKHTRDLLPYGAYSGSFAGLIIIYILAALLLSSLREPQPTLIIDTRTERPLPVILRQPLFIIAVLASAISYGIMSFIMTATPVSMHIFDGHSLSRTAFVIQSHIVAMFLPSFFTGPLIAAWGTKKVMLAGIAATGACIGVTLLNHEVYSYWVALVFLGLGWNFLFVCGTSLLTKCYNGQERFKTQAANDFIVFGIQATASLSAGAVIHLAGWETINLACLPFLLILMTAVLRLNSDNC